MTCQPQDCVDALLKVIQPVAQAYCSQPPPQGGWCQYGSPANNTCYSPTGNCPQQPVGIPHRAIMQQRADSHHYHAISGRAHTHHYNAISGRARMGNSPTPFAISSCQNQCVGYGNPLSDCQTWCGTPSTQGGNLCVSGHTFPSSDFLNTFGNYFVGAPFQCTDGYPGYGYLPYTARATSSCCDACGETFSCDICIPSCTGQ